MENVDWGWLLFRFDGRINRAKWWIGLLVVYVVVALVYALAFAFDSGVIYWIAVTMGFLVLWPYLALQIKRWHDRDKSGWWVLIGLIPLIGNLWVLIECGFLAGTPGPNVYGPDPLAQPV
ncbi:MAG: DUF805 domain-containing protein [Acidimicrobiia bacterium]|nr:DUF805 domain-containing protein [Acidimicrobiia bacterium]